jgi:Phage integrase family
MTGNPGSLSLCFSLNLPTRIVPHQLRHTYATEMLCSGVSFPGVMKLLGHNSSDMTMKYLDIALPDLQREFHSARLHPRHLAPQPKVVAETVGFGLNGVIDSVLGTQHVLEMFRRTLPDNAVRRSLARLSNRLTKMLAQLRELNKK